MADIDAEDESTWPADLRALFENGLRILRGFDEEQARLDRRAETDVRYRIDAPRNQYAARRAAMIDTANDLLRTETLVAFHCTRLTVDEVVDVRTSGLDPLNPELLSRRVSARVSAGEISQKVGEHLLRTSRLGTNRLREEVREGLLWLIFTKTMLQNDRGVDGFFDYWGGEALSFPHDDDPEIATILTTVGKPAIVEASVPVSDIRPVGERLLTSFLFRRGIPTENDFQFEDQLKKRLPGSQIKRVITTDDDAFFELTGRNPRRHVRI